MRAGSGVNFLHFVDESEEAVADVEGSEGEHEWVGNLVKVAVRVWSQEFDSDLNLRKAEIHSCEEKYVGIPMGVWILWISLSALFCRSNLLRSRSICLSQY